MTAGCSPNGWTAGAASRHPSTPAKTSSSLPDVYKQLNAPLGELGRASLVYANRSVTYTDKAYASYLGKIGDITEDRNELANEIKAVLDAAAFHDHAVDEDDEDGLGHRARALIDRVKDLAEREGRDED